MGVNIRTGLEHVHFKHIDRIHTGVYSHSSSNMIEILARLITQCHA